jgi:hypothetical protein
MSVKKLSKENQDPIKVDVSKSTKPLLFVRVGHESMLNGYSWLPTHKQLKQVQQYFEDAVGDRYTVFVYHMGAEIEVEKGDKETRLLEVSPLDEFWKELEE